MMLADLMRKAAYSPSSHLRHTERALFVRALNIFDKTRQRKTGFAHILSDDGDEELPGAGEATPTLPACKFCDRQYRPKKKGQKFCSTECRKAAYYARQRKIRHKDPPAPEPVLESPSSCGILDDD